MRSLYRVIPLLLASVLAACNLATVPPAAPTAPPDQAQVCDDIISTALVNVGPSCDTVGRNEACYGYNQVDSQFRPGAETTFQNAGDLAQIDTLRLISTAPLSEDSSIWGVAILKAQADLPDTLPGENVMFVLYGGATLDDVTPRMDTVVMSTGLGAPACASAPAPAILIQSPHGQPVTMTINGADVRFGSTLHFTAVRNGLLTIAVIEGGAQVTAFGVTQNIGPGAQTTLPLGTTSGLTVVGPPSPPEPFDLAVIQRAPLSLLDLPVQIPPPIPAGPTATPTQADLPGLPVTNTVPPVTLPAPPTAFQTICTPRTDWAYTYIIQSGDTLFKIANRFGLSIAELQSGNCIENADLIQAGQALRVPVPLVTSTPTLTPTLTPTETPAATFTPTVADFRADETSLTAGQCTTLRWDVDNIREVYIEGKPTSGHNSLDVCPDQSTRYTLMVIHPNGDQVPYYVSIEVSQPTAR